MQELQSELRWRSCSSPTISASSPTWPTTWSCCTAAGSWRAAAAPTCCPRPRHPYLQGAAARGAAPAHAAGRAPDADPRGAGQRPRAAARAQATARQRADAHRRAAARGRGSAQDLPDPQGRLVRRRHAGRCVAVDDVSFTIARGECLRPGRRERLRQDHGVQDRSCARSSPMPAGRSSTPPTGRSTCWRSKGTALERFRRRLQYIFQDPFHSLNPRMTVVRHRRRAAGDPRHRRREGAGRAGQGAARRGRPGRAPPAPLSAQLLRRPAAADRHRPRAGAGPARC